MVNSEHTHEVSLDDTAPSAYHYNMNGSVGGLLSISEVGFVRICAFSGMNRLLLTKHISVSMTQLL